MIQKLLNKQDTYPSAIPNGAHSSETLFSGVFENLPIISGYSGLLQSVMGSADPHLNALSKHLSSAAGDVSWHKSEKREDRKREQGGRHESVLIMQEQMIESIVKHWE